MKLLKSKTKTINKIKLFKVDELSDGTKRFQSQLMVGRKAVDFIMGSDGIMKIWSNGENGFDFYEYKGSYEIIDSKSEMIEQIL